MWKLRWSRMLSSMFDQINVFLAGSMTHILCASAQHSTLCVDNNMFFFFFTVTFVSDCRTHTESWCLMPKCKSLNGRYGRYSGHLFGVPPTFLFFVWYNLWKPISLKSPTLCLKKSIGSHIGKRANQTNLSESLRMTLQAFSNSL